LLQTVGIAGDLLDTSIKASAERYSFGLGRRAYDFLRFLDLSARTRCRWSLRFQLSCLTLLCAQGKADKLGAKSAPAYSRLIVEAGWSVDCPVVCRLVS
jgi:hypothetical protein